MFYENHFPYGESSSPPSTSSIHNSPSPAAYDDDFLVLETTITTPSDERGSARVPSVSGTEVQGSTTPIPTDKYDSLDEVNPNDGVWHSTRNRLPNVRYKDYY